MDPMARWLKAYQRSMERTLDRWQQSSNKLGKDPNNPYTANDLVGDLLFPWKVGADAFWEALAPEGTPTLTIAVPRGDATGKEEISVPATTSGGTLTMTELRRVGKTDMPLPGQGGQPAQVTPTLKDATTLEVSLAGISPNADLNSEYQGSVCYDEKVIALVHVVIVPKS